MNANMALVLTDRITGNNIFPFPYDKAIRPAFLYHRECRPKNIFLVSTSPSLSSVHYKMFAKDIIGRVL